MADWRQIQARIRKAKASTTPADQLADLYQRTRDAMVAFELARWQEKAGDNVEAAKWYTAAAERFRRSQWRVKAEEALTRLGAPIPAPLAPDGPATAEQAAAKAEVSSDLPDSDVPVVTQSTELFTQKTDVGGSSFDVQDPKGESEGDAQPVEQAAAAGAVAPGTGGQPVKKHRRRGRRGGRNRRRDGQVGQPTTGTAAGAAAAEGGVSGGRREPVRQFSGRSEHAGSASSVASTPSYRPAPAEPVAEMPRRSFEGREGNGEAEAARSGGASPETFVGRMRTGEPALASRISQLESRLRRLLACPMASLEDADQAPAGPGVLLLSDSDQVTHYYIEECQTLRIGVGNLLRGSRGSKDWGQLKQRMAENLGIAEARVSKYLKDNCAVRWLQLDEGAPQLAHFAIAVLRPVVNE